MSAAIYKLVVSELSHIYHVEEKLPIYGDICYQLVIETKTPIESIINELKLPVKNLKISGKNKYATFEPFDIRKSALSFDLQDNLISISALCIYLDQERYDLPNPVFVKKELLFKYFNLPLPQPSAAETKEVITTNSGWLPELADLVAEYYNPYKKAFKFVTLDELTDKQIPFYPIPKIAGVRYPKHVTVSIKSNGIEMLPPRDSVLSHISNGYVTSAFGPCDLRFIGYNPEDKNISYIRMSNRYHLELSIEPKCPITFILVEYFSRI